ncbi:hypothetical protein GCM10010320_56100 [Streptomyces caelestis]|uniref:Uncharacterized protein n=1 Tax=Streptomyces caelestis TaxID=36816 RepID=A0A7W9LVJ3_9ACTN|nr:hypothetical protein [Streptomyces caelestis]GGW67666.1 hypothetical protein GCM10010320_56100 [Streptomyces caelestis]
MADTLGDLLDAAARGVFPPADGRTTIVPQLSPRDAGVLAFTAHSVVFTDEDPDWVRRTLAGTDRDRLAATMNARFLTALMDRTGRTSDTIDVLLNRCRAARGTVGRAGGDRRSRPSARGPRTLAA